jgi:hypothetical protein
LDEKGKLPGKFKRSCRNCGKTGHKKDKCWATGGDAEGKGPQGRVNSEKASWVFGAKHLAAGKEEDWILDSGASDHMTNKIEYLQEVQLVDKRILALTINL